DIGINKGDKGYILIKGALMIACALISLMLGLFYARYAATAGQGFGAELREAEYKKIQKYSFKNIDYFSTSSLVTRLTSDVTIVQNAVSAGIRPIVRAPIMLLMGLSFSILINWKLALVFLVAIPILGLFLYLIIYKVKPLYGFMQKAMDEVNRTVQENLIAIRVVKSYVREEYEIEKFESVNDDLKEASQRAFHYSSFNLPCFQLVMYITTISILWFGGNLIFIGSMKVGELTAFLSYILQILNSLMMISGVFMMLTRSLASGTRILEVLDEDIDIKDEGDPNALVTKGNIDFEHVFFKYQESAKEYVLSDINLHIKAGQVVGILGGTGAAKSSLVQLIPRLYDVSKGDVKIDGRSVKDYGLVHLRDSIGMVLQKNTLFSGSIKDNLLWGNEHATEKDIERACHISCVDEFVSHMPDGLNTDLGQGGINISGGQKQRLCIARAILKKPKVLIFDDSTSAVDTATDSKIRERLAQNLKDCTQIIIAQRISSIEHADQIIMMDDGKITSIGTHQSLLRDNEAYRATFESQRKGVGL
ncbi:MAG TPA: ABC transporter ATP-binding protein, partial [Candidatus Merdenecus merdavium]|nr:ABC transporter ATP-binding protein [Candidatus Merdenecus merdavium]